MARLNLDQWQTIRARREAGHSFNSLAKEFGVSHQAIQKRANNEGWGDGTNVEEVIRRKAAEKVAGLVATDNQEKKAQAIDDEAEKVAAVRRRHRQEWVQVAVAKQRAMEIKGDEKLPLVAAKLRVAKLLAETTKIQQEGERKAWGMDEQQFIDYSKLTDAQLEDLIAGKTLK